MKRDPPKIAQFTAINGRKIPNEPYKAGENFSTIISYITFFIIIKSKKNYIFLIPK